MIEKRQEIIFVLDEYIKAQREWIHQTWVPDLARWSTKRQSLYWNGIVLGKFRERDPLTMQILEKQVSDTALQEELCIFFSRKIKTIMDTAKPDILQERMLPKLKKQYKQLLVQTMDEWIDDYHGFKKQETIRRTSPKISRNDPCPCGSGKKYKLCCGRNC